MRPPSTLTPFIPVALLLISCVPVFAADFFGIEADTTPKMVPVTLTSISPKAATIAEPAPVGKTSPEPSTSTGLEVATLSTFNGIPWGTSLPEAQRMTKSWGSLPELQMIPGKRLVYGGGSFAGRPLEKWGMEFQQGRLYCGALFLRKEGSSRDQFAAMQKVLAEKYGPHSRREGAATGSELYEWKLAATAPDHQEKLVRCIHIPNQGVTLAFINETVRIDVVAR